MGGRRTGRLSFQDIRWHPACRQPGYVAAELLAFRYVRGGEAGQELDGEAVRQQHLQHALLHGVVSECDAVRAGSAWPHGVDDALGAILSVDAMLICVPNVLAKDEVA